MLAQSTFPSAAVEQTLSDEFGAAWGRVQSRLVGEVGEAAYKSWLAPLSIEGLFDGVVRLGLPTRFMRDWVNTHYLERLRRLWAAEDAGVLNVDLVVVRRGAVAMPVSATSAAPTLAPGPMAPIPASPVAKAPRAVRPAAPAIVQAEEVTTLDSLSAPLDPRLTFDNFVVGKPNELAFAAARRVAESDAVAFNPLYLYGGVGLGKTHLMHAIAWHIRQRDPSRRVIYMSAEKFMYQFIKALRYKDTVAFKEQFRSVDVLMIDDVQFFCGSKELTQEEFFHTFNALVDNNRQVIVSADKSPADLSDIPERLKSRLGWGLVADIHPTTYELRLGILQAKADAVSVPVPPKVLEFLAHKITSNVRELEGALNRLVAHATLVHRAISLEMAQEVLHDLLRAHDRRVTIEEIQKRVAEHYTIRLVDMSSARRSRQIARPRQVAMYLAKQLTSRSLPEIGRKFGGRDHTTVMHAVKKIEELQATDSALAEDIELLRRMLES
ncbi:chromosomal replication initiator protein DnaA [Lacibacterium aquatile]|uniref:Chromosomal replication initiator protein DnaA n=1 Tax=Lacibacterium aquatile TaxID=1168082 RepID=A0ABW5DPI0_9PROT